MLDGSEPRKARMHALWALVGTGALDADFHARLLAHEDAALRAWGVRAAGNMSKVRPGLRDRVVELAADSSPDVRVQVAIAARKVEGIDPIPVLLRVLAADDDKLIPAIVWQNLQPLLEDNADKFLRATADQQKEIGYNANVLKLMPRVTERVLARRRFDPGTLDTLFAMLTVGPFSDAGAARGCMAALAARVQSGEISGEALQGLADKVVPRLRHVMGSKGEGRFFPDDYLLAATLRVPEAVEFVRREFVEGRQNERIRLKELEVLVFLKDPAVPRALPALLLLDAKVTSVQFRGQVLAALGKLEAEDVATAVLAAYPGMEPELQPRAVELLTQRTSWSKKLLQAIADKKVPAGVLNVNQVRKLLAGRDPDVIKQVRAQWGTLREERNPEREKVVADMRQMLSRKRGDAVAGAAVFKKVCAQCHKIYGEGQEVGPDVTSNGRGSFEQLLSNVFDPSLVIGAAYQATTVRTKKGRVVTGLLVEDTPQRVVLKVQGGEREVIPRGQVDKITVSKMSLMPEDLEKQLQPQEIVDLFAFLTLDRPPGDPEARRIPGTPK